MIPAFQGSDIQAIICVPMFRNAFTNVETIFMSFTHNMNSPTNTPTNRDRMVSLVTNANAIATRGGNNVSTPNLTELSTLVGAEEIHNDKIKRAIIETAAIKPNFILFFIYYHTILLYMY